MAKRKPQPITRQGWSVVEDGMIVCESGFGYPIAYLLRNHPQELARYRQAQLARVTVTVDYIVGDKAKKTKGTA